MPLNKEKGLTYADAGVDIDAGNKAVELMKASVKATYTPNVLGDLGGFGGLYSLAGHNLEEPVIVAGTDGVGTKLRLAIDLGIHNTIGCDCVAMSVNDILVQGAKPLFFLDYIAVGKLEPTQVADIVRGVAEACLESGCALLGGETAEMAGFYTDGDYDVAGFAVGIVDKKKIITGADIKPGDIILGLPSSGLHSNGYSLVRKIIEVAELDLNKTYNPLQNTLGKELLTPTRLYPQAVLPLLETINIKGLVHITGGGFYDNIPRILPEGIRAVIDGNAYPLPAIFPLLAEWGNVAAQEMYRTFNMGIGMILIVDPIEVVAVLEDLQARGEAVYRIGEISEGTKDVLIRGGLFDE